MYLKKLLAAVTGSALLLSSLSVTSVSAGDSDFTYEVNADGVSVTITGCTLYGESAIAIPATIGDYAVTAIAADAFDGGKMGTNFENLAEVSVPASVTDIDFAAFSDCVNIVSVVIDDANTVYQTVDSAVYSEDGSILYFAAPSLSEYTVVDGTVEIAGKALAYGDEYNSITKITIPASVTTIADFATVYGPAVTIYGEAGSAAETFAADNRNNFVAAEEIFIIEVNEDGTTATLVGCTDYESAEIAIPETVNGYTITAIAASAFAANDKLDANFENLTAVTIPATVEDIDFSAFNDCENLETITVDSANAAYKSTDGNTAVYSADGSTLYYVIPGERAYTVADGTVEIADYALAYGNEDSNSIRDITIPESVTTIGKFATVYGPATIIRGSVGSAAETFAEENNNTFIGDILYGDADDDGDVDGYDALYCLQASVFQVEPGEVNILQGNVDGADDGVLTSNDALLILQYCALSIDHFPIEG